MRELHTSRGSSQICFTSLPDALANLPERCVLISDEHVARLFGDMLAGRTVLTVPQGEASKSLEHYAILVRDLASRRVPRGATLVALGGGVVGDLAGFVAATYLRGVALIQIPTTLLAQVDSSVGGKTGIDLPEGKNLVGAFWPADRVVVCVDALRTLSTRQFRNGLAEVWKTALIGADDLFGILGPGLVEDEVRLRQVVERCIQFKADIVEADEFETTGLRAFLNFGHTVGHAIEKVERYRGMLHGEAISVGMVVECEIGEKLGITPAGTTAFVRDCLVGTGLPTESETLADVDTLIAAMRGDKKSDGQNIAMSLLTGIGGCKLVHNVPEAVVREVLNLRP